MTSGDPFDLRRFLEAQALVHEQALAELRAGTKRSHWMWFVFPQLRGLGRSPMAQRYGIGSLEEARAYLAHPVLRPRLEQCTQAVLGHADRTLYAIFGSPDDVKFSSSMTLFAQADPAPASLWRQAIDAHCDGRLDQATLDLLRG
ncbi:MAG TPA: DUF1810 domain-containing protein [Beijerinckiaceae bacterium]|jgi:uncharacterized protein (DUF1810 family)